MTHVDEWLKSGKYLPEVLRDFHDQKDVFQAIDQTVKDRPDDLVKRPGWIEAQCYVIDVLLWYMARRGYTLQRSRRRGWGFRDLEADVKACKDARNVAFNEAFRAIATPHPKEGGKE